MIDLSQQGYTHREIIRLLERRGGIEKAYYRVEITRNSGHVGWVEYKEFSMECDADASVKYSGILVLKDDTRVNWRTDFFRLVMFWPVDEETTLRFNFVPLKPVTPADSIQGSIVDKRVELFDESVVLKDNSLGDAIVFEMGTPYLAAVKQIITETGFQNLMLEPSDKALATDRLFEAGEERLTVANTLLEEIGYTTLEMLPDGSLYSAPYSTPGIENAKIHYESGCHSSIIYEDKTLETDSFKRHNRFIGYCSNPEMETNLRFEYINESPGSPTSTVSQGYTITAPPRQYDNVPDQETLALLVMKWAEEVAQSYRYGSFRTAIMPHHGVSDVMTIQSNGINGVWIENWWRISISESEHIMEHKVRSLDYD